MRYMRNILGVPDSTSQLAVLVRLGIMPLNYLLAYRSAIWYLKLIRGLCGPALPVTCILNFLAMTRHWDRQIFLNLLAIL